MFNSAKMLNYIRPPTMTTIPCWRFVLCYSQLNVLKLMKEIYFVKSGNLSCKVETYSYKLAVLFALSTYLCIENQELGKIISSRKKGKNSFINETYFSTEQILKEYFDLEINAT